MPLARDRALWRRPSRDGAPTRRVQARAIAVAVVAAVVAAATPLTVTAAGPMPGAAPVTTLHPTGFVPSGATPGLKSRALSLMRSSSGMYPDAVDLSAYAPAVGNQGAVGSCTSWATGYYLRYWLRNHALGETTTFAPMYLYSQIVRGQNVGTSFASNFNILDSQGIAPQSAYPQGNNDYSTQPTAAETAAAAPYKATSYAMLYSGANAADQSAIQGAMASGIPVVLAIPVYPEFDRVSASNGWLVNAPTGGESSRGAHALFAAKYDAKGVWIENSWGTAWGDAGWAELSWDFINRYSYEAWTLSSSGTDVRGSVPVISTFAPVSGTVGASVVIQGQNLSGATAVSFHGTPAGQYTVDSATQITALVPPGATSGAISVSAPSGSAASSGTFTVIPPPVVASLAASPAAIKFDPNGYCPTAATSTVITARTKAASPAGADAASVTLLFTRPDGSPGSMAMTAGATTSGVTAWTAALSSATDRALTAGRITYAVSAAASGGGAVTRFPASGTQSITVAACGNVPPTIASLDVRSAGPVYVDPLGTGSMPDGATTSVTLRATGVADSDGIASVTATLSNAGLGAPVTLPLALEDGVWSATADLGDLGVQGGPLAWSVKAVDARGLASAAKPGIAIAVARADSPGTAVVTGVTGLSGKLTITAAADDPDATWTSTTSTAKARLVWAASYQDASGALRTLPPASTTPTVSGLHAYTAVITAPWLTTGITNVRLTASLTITDPFGKVSVSEPRAFDVVPAGPPTVVALGSTGADAPVYTNPLGSGSVPSAATTRVTFGADVRDTDAVASVAVSYTGPGLSAARSLPLTYSDSSRRWTGTLDLSGSGVTGTGRVAWTLVVTDAAGNTTRVAGTGFPVVRADSAGSIAASGAGYDVSGNMVVLLTGDDPDGAFDGTRTTLVASLRWSGVVGTTTYAVRTTTASYIGSHTWKVVLPVGAALSRAGAGSFTWTPMTKDPYGYVTTGATTTSTVPPAG